MATQGFASSPGRVSRADALADLRRMQESGDVPRAFESLAAPVAILNAQRQVIFSNPAFQALAGLADAEAVCGRRPGEALGCRNAGGGCGDEEACGFCGARGAIVETITSGRPSARECHVSVDGAAGYDLMVSTTPFEIAGSSYVMVSFRDISDLQRRRSLERIFFHDMLNTASSFRVYLDLLRRDDLPQDNRARLLSQLSVVCDTLEEEIQGQKIMVSAENGTLRAQRNLIETHALLLQSQRQAEGLPAAQGRTLLIAPFSESFSFVSDDALVKRILANMVKNALEAVAPGAAVSLGARRDAEGHAVLTVHNPGRIVAEAQARVFQRYFSTKGEGRGLGTWGMKLLAEEYMGGRVEFRSSPEEGTTFSLILPPTPPLP
jgi:hypothetical protein